MFEHIKFNMVDESDLKNFTTIDKRPKQRWIISENNKMEDAKNKDNWYIYIAWVYKTLLFLELLIGKELTEKIHLTIENTGEMYTKTQNSFYARKSPCTAPSVHGQDTACRIYLNTFNVERNMEIREIIFQLAHELMHFFFFAHCKYDKDKFLKSIESNNLMRMTELGYNIVYGNVPDIEEILCAAMAVTLIKTFGGKNLTMENIVQELKNYEENASEEYYRKGYELAESISYDYLKLEKYFNEVIDYYNLIQSNN